MGYRVINGKLHLVGDFPAYNKVEKNKGNKNTGSFEDILNKKINNNESFVISNHAAERLKQRNISFNEADMKSINEGINKAEEKGSKESLILYKDTALITSIKNRTIITAVDKESSKGNVFTNVDSVVIL
ncbi:TIGR02530 family flagellar biosynthesis protein [Clostridium thailandense]|uniref:Flagellar biosynthesis protein n=1 Tax=Clostridium thailandense TaxID=2794346 RepID=A0A949TTR7_9CLOT|nr:TIGR02530 family flagellar biosynthesis protein [Clostridium thailandense]MBV7272213.1 flagellar biosynthesis protein [Clostridium thailandense]MCH5136502.1 flagellar biosynthesis protein [Clostridiaceae bacterium UIB06]